MNQFLERVIDGGFRVREVSSGREFICLQMGLKFEIALPDIRMDGVVVGAGGQIRGLAGDYILYDSKEGTYLAVRSKDERGGHVFEKLYVRI